MSTKRPRSPSTSADEDTPSLKRVLSSIEDGDQKPTTEAISPSQETSQAETTATQPDALEALPNVQERQEQYASPSGMMVLAPTIQAMHQSWEAFDDALRAYSKATYQLYVIRSTTSVKRRNLKISETAAGSSSNTRASGDQGEAVETAETVEKTLIPEKFQWYSKSLKCTHGWKDRHRGTGKRGSGVVRSTSCPAKMCVTLQHRGAGPEDWQVVVTKHVRAHNHQLSKELYLYYSENRRIYDPDLLAVGGETLASGGTENTVIDLSNEGEVGQLSSLIDQATSTQRSRTLVPGNSGMSTAPFVVPDASGRTAKPLVGLSEASSSSFVIRPRSIAGTPTATSPPPGAVVLTSGSMAARVMDGGDFRVPRVSMKAHMSWEAFHNYVSEYSFDTGQVFRTRSTVSVASRNAKALAAAASKTGEDTHEVASYASYAAASPTARLIPEEFKWHSKLLICTYGWKRKSRSKGSHFPGGRSGDSDGEPCPAMLLARVERNVDGEWRVIINRQVQEHNHRLNANIEEADVVSNRESMESASLPEPTMGAPSVESEPTGTRRTDSSSFIQPEASLAESSIEGPPPLSVDQRDIVVRVPKMPSVFSSWDDFHASLKAYSDATFQLYRTRTTSSAKGRNQKIAEMKRANGNDENVGDAEDAVSGIDATRMIPELWRWYSKTLMCTHGWKERHRGTGKRTAHVVRSTSCPVKICATVQYMRQPTRLGNSSQLSTAISTSAEYSDTASSGSWRVVVTKHVVDHNHNLSRELYQHYCENRRIYDPDLLAIDTSNAAAVVRRKVYRGLPESIDVAGDVAAQSTQPGSELLASQPPALSTQIEVGLTETVNRDQLFGTNLGSSMESVVQRIAGSVATSVGASQQSVPSVVLLPYNSAGSFLPGQIQSQTQQQQQQQQEALIQAAFAGNITGTLARAGSTGGEGVTTLTAVATPGLAPANILLLNNAAATVGTLPQTGTNVISISCRLHGSAVRNSANLGTTGNDVRDAVSEETPQCTCFRIAGSGNYVTIVPAAEPTTPVENSFDADDENMFYTEDMEGVWQPSSTVEIENVTTDTGETVWRVPYIVRRYPTWEAFHKYLDAYSAATFQLYRVRTTYSVRSRNVRLRQLAASRGLIVRNGVEGDNSGLVSEAEREGTHGLSRAHLVPEHYEWYSKTFLCTHGWKRRSRGSGQRVSHNTRATECPAKVCATLQRDGANKWSVVVTKHAPEHNHEVSETMYQQYCEVRRVRDPEVLAQAESLWRSGATRRRVFEFLKDQAQNHVILMKDVHNLVQRWQAQERRPTQAQLQAAQAEQTETVEHGQEKQQQVEQDSSPVVSAGHGDEGWLVNGHLCFEMAYFQGGEFVELLSAQGKAPAASWKLQGKISKTFDKSIKGNTFQLDGSSETKMQLPKITSSSLGLAQRFVVLQLLVPFTRSFSVEICFSDFQKVRRRFVVASAFREITRTTLHVQLPLDTGDLPRDQWMNLVFDLQALSEVYFPDTGFRSMESICVGGSCRLKRVFTMKDAPTPSRGAQGVRHADIRGIPRQFEFSAAHRGASGALPIPTLYFAMMPALGAGILEVTGTTNGGPQKSGRRSQTAPTNAQTKPTVMGVRGMRPNSGIERKAPDSSTSANRLDTKGSKMIVPGHRRLRTPAKVNIACGTNNRPQSRSSKIPPSDRRSPSELLSSAFEVEEPCHDRPIDNQDNDESIDQMRKVDMSLKGQDEETRYVAVAPTHREISREQNPLGSAQNLTNSRESSSLRSSLVKSPRDSDTAERGNHRQSIMGEIQQKIAFLEDEDARADQRSRELFLHHTSLLSGEWHLQDEEEDHDHDMTQLSDDDHIALSSSWRRELRDTNTEPLVTSSNIKQRLSHISTSVEALMTSFQAKEKESIFLFPQSSEPGADYHRSTSRLFSFDSLLQDGKVYKSLRDREQDTASVEPPLLANLQPHGRNDLVDTTAAEDDGDMELMELLAAKRSARQPLRQTEGNNSRGDIGVLREGKKNTTEPSKARQEKDNDSSKSKMEENGATVPHPVIPADAAMSDDSSDGICSKVVESTIYQVGVRQPGSTASPLKQDDGQTASAQDSDVDLSDDDNALSIDLTSELSGEHDEFEDSTSRPEPSSQHSEKRNPVSDSTPIPLEDHESDSSFDFEDLMGESGPSDEDERSEDKKKNERTKLAVSSDHVSVEQVPASRKSSIASPSRQNQHEDRSRVAISGLPRRSVKSPLIESRHNRGDQDKPQQISSREWPPTPPRPNDLSSSFSSRRLQKLLESTDWTAELSAHVDTIGISSSQSPLLVRSNDQSRKSSRYRSPPENSDVQWSTTRRSTNRTSRKLFSPPRTPSTAASIELVYDPLLRCYYDPIGNKYYALAE